MAAALPERTEEEIEADWEEWLNHPLNCKELTPDMLEREEFQALQAMQYDGTPVEIARNFKNHAYEQLGHLLLKKSKNTEKDFQEAMHCFEQALEQKCGDDKLEFDLLLGKAKLNMLRGQFGKSKEDCLEALKRKKTDEQAWYILARSRIFVEKYQEAMDYISEGLSILPKSPKLQFVKAECETKRKEQIERVKKIEIINNVKEDEMMKVYRDIRAKGIKLGKRLHELPEVANKHVTLDKRGKLHFPVLILYDEFMVTDFIEDF